MLGRRAFLKALGMAPMAAPLAFKAAMASPRVGYSFATSFETMEPMIIGQAAGETVIPSGTASSFAVDAKDITFIASRSFKPDDIVRCPSGRTVGWAETVRPASELLPFADDAGGGP